MKFSILGFNQENVLSLSRNIIDKTGKDKNLQLDVVDLLILREIADFMNRKQIIKYNIDDKTFFSVQYSVILEDLPILNIKRQALADRIDKMVILGVIEKYLIKNQSGSFTAFRLTEKYENLVYQSTSSRLQVQKYQTTSANVVDYDTKDNITNTNNKEDKDKSLSKKETIDYQKIVDAWNNMTNNIDTLSKVLRLTDSRKKSIATLLKKTKSNVDELIRFIKTIPYADEWVVGKSKGRDWHIEFDWLMKNTSEWYTRGLEGEMHKINKNLFKKMMSEDYEEPTNVNINGIEYQ